MRLAGVKVATPQSTLDAAQVLLPGVFVVLVTWVGAHLAASGDITAGQLVAFYGYAGFLVIPLRTSAEAVEKITRALVGARRMLRVLAVERAVKEPVDPLPEPPAGVPLSDPHSGLTIAPGGLTCLVSAAPDETSLLADRLGRIIAELRRPARRHGARPAAARRRAPADPRQRARSADLLGHAPQRARPVGALERQRDHATRSRSPAAEDVLVALPGGLDEVVDERGRSFSGGQRQRLVLARALLADAEILVLVEPTSAVDAHTEARIARQLHEFRAGKTTVVVSSSPLMLDQADTVVLIADGKVQAEGTHRELLRTHPAYRDVVTRGEAA